VTFEQAIIAANDALWRKEKRAGVEHFVTGQHRAWPVDDPTAVSDEGVRAEAILAYVPVMGHSVIFLILHRAEGTWATTGQAFHIQCSMPRTELLPPDFALSEKMLAAIAVAGIA
jgi:hypothetical protein